MANKSEKSFGGLGALSEEMDTLFESIFGLRHPVLEAKGIWHPPVDVIETETEYVVSIDIAGIRQEDVRLTYEAGLLIVRGIRREIDYGPERHFHIMEIDCGPFERRIKLPKAVDSEAIEATYKDGILEVRLEKKSEPSEGTVIIEVE